MAGVLDEIAYRRMIHMIQRRPLDINVETVSRCPMRCVFCCNRIYERNYTVMDNELFEKIVKEYCELFRGGGIGIGAMQSDFLSDPLLLERIGILKKYKKRLWIYSTTPLISCSKYTDKELLKILEVFDYLQISAEGHDEESYRTMAGVNGFGIFEEQLQRVRRIVDMNALKVRIVICFRTYNRWQLKKSDFYQKISRQFEIEDIKDSFFSWFGSVREEDLPKGAHLLVSDNSNKTSNCVNPNFTLAVQADGKVVGCGCIDWLEKYIVGDCRKHTLKEIWGSRRSRKFRDAFQRGRLPSICRECGLYSSMDKSLKDARLLDYRPSDGLWYLVKRLRSKKCGR